MIGEILSIILYLVFLFLILSMAFAALSSAPWVPSRSRDIKRILKLADVRKGQIAYDLGCGDGKVICAFAKEGARATGFEVSLFQYLQSLWRIFFCKFKNKNLNVKVKFKNFWKENLGDADLVYVFLMERVYPKLKEKLKKELKPGARVIVYAWPIDGWKPLAVDEISGQQPIYLYKI